MSKKTKKRNKAYQGADAASATPTVHRYTAVKRSRAGEWWHEKRRVVKIVTIATGVVVFLVIIVGELISLLANGV